MDELEAALAADGVEDLILGVLPGNDAAIRLYERRRYRPTWLYLSRLRGRRTSTIASVTCGICKAAAS